MVKVTLDIKDFKALASETRLDILKALDGKNMNLQDISAATNLHEVTIFEHLGKLVEAGFVKKQEREGHKWVYYRLSWKGESLMHPENTRVVVLFSATFFTLSLGIFTMVYYLQQYFMPRVASDGEPLLGAGEPTVWETMFPPELLGTLALICIPLFILLLSVSFWRYRKNKPQKL